MLPSFTLGLSGLTTSGLRAKAKASLLSGAFSREAVAEKEPAESHRVRERFVAFALPSSLPALSLHHGLVSKSREFGPGAHLFGFHLAFLLAEERTSQKSPFNWWFGLVWGHHQFNVGT